jgi:hypothetical protein
MAVIGIDFGGNRLRAAAPHNGGAQLFPHSRSAERMPFVFEVVARDGRPQLRINSLKRLLDFEKSLPVPPTGVGSLELVAKLLEQLRVEYQRASGGHEVNCVMAVPPFFSQRQRSTLRAAAVGAGFARVRLVDDTLAALLASRKRLDASERVLVYSWGASSFSVALYQVRGGGYQVMAQEGSRESGANDLDAHMAAFILGALPQEARARVIGAEEDFLERLVDEVERAKPMLSRGEPATVRHRDLFPQGSPLGREEASVILSPDTFNEKAAEMTAETAELAARVLAAGKDIPPQAILVSGGMTQLPVVRRMLAERFGLPLVDAGEEAVAFGAAMLGQSVTQMEWEKQERLKEDEPRSPAEQVKPPASPSNGEDAGAAPAAARTARAWSDAFVPLLNTAQRQYEQGQVVEAVATFERLFGELGRFSGEIYRQAASSMQGGEKSADALEILQRANHHSPSNRAVALDLARSYHARSMQKFQEQRHHEAVEQSDLGVAVIRALPQAESNYREMLAQMLHTKGCALHKLREYREAEQVFAECVRLDPQNHHYVGHLETLRAALGKAVPAKNSLLRRKKVGRNDLCPCGSGLKHKKCCASKG